MKSKKMLTGGKREKCRIGISTMVFIIFAIFEIMLIFLVAHLAATHLFHRVLLQLFRYMLMVPVLVKA